MFKFPRVVPWLTSKRRESIKIDTVIVPNLVLKFISSLR